jgi:hypothetical protein
VLLLIFDGNVVRMSHGLGVSGADAGGCCQGGRLVSSNGGIVSDGANAGGYCQFGRMVSSNGGDECRVFLWREVEPKLGWISNSNRSKRHLSGCFFGGWMPLGSNPMSQLLFFAASRYFFMKVSIFAFLPAGILSFEPWLAMRGQLS